MRITLFGLIVVLGAAAIVVYAIWLHQLENGENQGTTDDTRFAQYS